MLEKKGPEQLLFCFLALHRLLQGGKSIQHSVWKLTNMTCQNPIKEVDVQNLVLAKIKLTDRLTQILYF